MGVDRIKLYLHILFIHNNWNEIEIHYLYKNNRNDN